MILAATILASAAGAPVSTGTAAAPRTHHIGEPIDFGRVLSRELRGADLCRKTGQADPYKPAASRACGQHHDASGVKETAHQRELTRAAADAVRWTRLDRRLRKRRAVGEAACDTDHGEQLVDGKCTFPMLTIPIKWIVIHSGDDGKILQSKLQEQVDVLNEAFAGCTDSKGVDTRMRFTMTGLSGIEPVYVDNPEWFTSCYSSEDSIKQQYINHAQWTSTKVVYIISCRPSDGLLGWSTIPDMSGFTDPDSYVQGTFLLDTSLPGNAGDFGEGDTATHELGHYFGLYHTFQGGCGSSDQSNSGDFVLDTPAEGAPRYDCSGTSDTCTVDDGFNFGAATGGGVSSADPDWDFMDYPTDACMTRFTMGQALRMRRASYQYKKSHVESWASFSPITFTCPAGSQGGIGASGPVSSWTSHAVTSSYDPAGPAPVPTARPTVPPGTPTSEPTAEPTPPPTTPSPTPPPTSCDKSQCVDPGWFGDGYCDPDNNVQECCWDGGDCCKDTCECEGDGCWTCGEAGYDCQDPNTSGGGGGPTAPPVSSPVAQPTAEPTFATGVVIPCTDGSAAGRSCSNVNLAAFMSFNALTRNDVTWGADDWPNGPQEAYPTSCTADCCTECIGQMRLMNDNWGYTDPDTGVQIAVVGSSDRTVLIDVTDAASPVFLGFIPQNGGGAESTEAASLWKDVKVHGSWVFIGSEAVDFGIQYLDLKPIAASIADVRAAPRAFRPRKNAEVSTSHNLVINDDAPVLYTAASNLCRTLARIPFVVDATNGVQFATGAVTNAACASGVAGSEVHDAQCVIYDGPDLNYQGQEICFMLTGGGGSLSIYTWAGDFVIADKPYTGAVYSHQGWLTDDKRYFFLGDEMDTGKTTTHIFDVSNLAAPQLLNPFRSAHSYVDHNMYMIGNLLFQANYAGGLRLLRFASGSESPLVEVGHFDTSDVSDTQMGGAWSVFPYFPTEGFSAGGQKVVVSGDEGVHVLETTSAVHSYLSVASTTPAPVSPTPPTPAPNTPAPVTAEPSQQPSAEPTPETPVASPTMSPVVAPTGSGPTPAPSQTSDCSSCVEWNVSWIVPTVAQSTLELASDTGSAGWDLFDSDPFVNGDDDTTKTIKLPFGEAGLAWYCQKMLTMVVSVNGWVTFSTSEGSPSVSHAWEQDRNADNTLAVQWSDMVIPASALSGIYGKYVGGLDPHVLISWEGLADYGQSGVSFTFQARIYPSGKFKVDYQANQDGTRQCPPGGNDCGSWTKGPSGVNYKPIRSQSASVPTPESVTVCDDACDTCSFGGGTTSNCDTAEWNSTLVYVAQGVRHPDVVTGAGGGATEKLGLTLAQCGQLCMLEANSTGQPCFAMNHLPANSSDTGVATCRIWKETLATYQEIDPSAYFDNSTGHPSLWSYYEIRDECIDEPPTEPTTTPVAVPSTVPSTLPTALPTAEPPSFQPSTGPGPGPTRQPASSPSAAPSSDCSDQISALMAENAALLAEIEALKNATCGWAARRGARKLRDTGDL